MATRDEPLTPEAADAVILCSTVRLARSLRQSLGRRQQARGVAQWQPARIQTLTQWLDAIVSRAMLAGEVAVDALPRQQLDSVAEHLLWEQAIAKDTADDPAQALFDLHGMAQAAAEANRLLLEWSIPLPQGQMPEETRRFLQWRTAFRQSCGRHQAIEAARLMDMQIELLRRGAGRLPAVIHYAGFDRMSEQEKRLLAVLQARGTTVAEWMLGTPQAAVAEQVVCDNIEEECRAAAGWAAGMLAAQPDAKLAIVAPELGALRRRLGALLDDVLQRETLHPSLAQLPRRYDFSLGEPLAAHPMVTCALALLRIVASRFRLSQAELGRQLRDPYWGGERESDARARLEVRMRRKLGATLSLDRFQRFVNHAQLDGFALPRLAQQLQSLNELCSAWPKRQAAGAWAIAFGEALEAAGWPGERSLSSHEYQARMAWDEVLVQFADLADLLGPMDGAAALNRLARLCRERIFQPEAGEAPHILVMGMLETPAEPLDAIWVMGMNDHRWPPPASPNPLLPAEAQRRAGVPGAGSQVQAEFAAAIHRRLLHSAPHILFSCARKEGERELRPSPVLQGLPLVAAPYGLAETLAESLAAATAMQWLDDYLAPPVAAGEVVSGGTGLLKAQALCPAWAYYRYRLGARALDVAVDGLDALERGSLLHAVLQAFWSGRTSEYLRTYSGEALQDAISAAVERGIELFAQHADEQPPPSFMALERARLERVMAAWLELESTREPFAVLECERKIELDVGGLLVTLVLDRVDQLPDGRLVVIDYKTGASVSHRSWAEPRIAEPQLPVYAALALSGSDVAAVCFAKVRADEQKFIGIAADSDILPGVNGLAEARGLFPEERFADWMALIGHWRQAIAAIADEIRHGHAAVRFEDEAALRDCEVKPLLRLPERKLQIERGGA